ncbi:hypothetical protein [Burkholderia seminalis]|uniref:hypothetical protein n=1 Tax=Burkholderia seminalis TaxID=488731 RepID=UPI001CF30627|nr:hypothetical protein [Burkholderia seminalis]MCA8428584.1 hypothetical protein [Burkholderia seminalis]
MTLPAKPGRQIGQAIGLGAIVAVLTACTVAFLLYASRRVTRRHFRTMQRAAR